jgi:hypothetical protein
MFSEVKDQAMVAEVAGIWDAEQEWAEFSADLDDDPKTAPPWAAPVLGEDAEALLEHLHTIPAREHDTALECIIECLELPRRTQATERALARIAFLVGRAMGTLHQVEENAVMERFIELDLTDEAAYV